MTNAHEAEIRWQRDGGHFTAHQYSRVHTWGFDGGTVIRASSSPTIVRVPFSDPSAVDPEEAFVASLSSCHMLWFLDLAATAGFEVDSYRDAARGHLTRRSDGKQWLSRVELRPIVEFSQTKQPSDEQLESLHHQAHEACFLANAVKCEVIVQRGDRGP